LEGFKKLSGISENHWINDKGEVYSEHIGRVMKYRDNGNGRMCLHINRQVQYRYRLIALYFIPNPDNKPEVNHIDGDSKNDHISNLEWTTTKENHDHMMATKWNYVLENVAEEIYEEYERGATLIELSKKYKVLRRTIRTFLLSRGVEIRHECSKSTWRTVECFTRKGIKIAEFQNIAEAEKWLQYLTDSTTKKASEISKCCKGYRVKSVCGLVWKYKEEDL